MSNKKKRNKEKKLFNKDKEMVACPNCNAMVYPISSATNEKGEPIEIICSSCKEDILPMIEAYKEYVSIRAKQRQEEREKALLEEEKASQGLLLESIIAKQAIEGEYSVVSTDESTIDSEGNIPLPISSEPGMHTVTVSSPKTRKP